MRKFLVEIDVEKWEQENDEVMEDFKDVLEGRLLGELGVNVKVTEVV